MRRFVFAAGMLLIVAACAPSPLFVGSEGYTPGAVPRDQFGRPVLERIAPPPEIPEISYEPVNLETVPGLPPAQPLPAVPSYPELLPSAG